MPLFSFNVTGLARTQMRRIEHQLTSLKEIIMVTQAQHAQEIRELRAQNDKARQEVIDKIGQLEAELQNAGGTTPEVDAAMQELKDSVRMDDEMHPDATTPTDPVTPTPTEDLSDPTPTNPNAAPTQPNPAVDPLTGEGVPVDPNPGRPDANVTSNPVEPPAQPAPDMGSPRIEDPDKSA